MSRDPMISAKIDVTKIDKTKLFDGKNGAKYLDVLLIPSKNSKYGDSHMVVQSVSKEEREKGVKGAILGNARYLGGPSTYQSAPQSRAPAKPADDEDKDPPF